MKLTKRHSQNAVAARARKGIERAEAPIDHSQNPWNSSQPMTKEEHESLANIHANKLSILCLEVVGMLRKERYQVAGQTLRTVQLEVSILAGHVARLIQ